MEGVISSQPSFCSFEDEFNQLSNGRISHQPFTRYSKQLKARASERFEGPNQISEMEGTLLHPEDRAVSLGARFARGAR